MAEGENTRRWRIGLAAVSVFTLTLTALAYAGRLPPQLFEADKAIHFTLAGVIAFFLDRATRGRSLKWAAALLALTGAEEIAQRWSRNRTSSIADYAADVAGVVVFTLLSRRLFSKAGSANTRDDVSK